jgi:uncharacterized membrane protein
MAIRFTTHAPIQAALAAAALMALACPARADLRLCSRMSYVVEAAIAIEDKGAAATRGWFRLDPGQCRTVLQGALPGENLAIHARALPVYGGSPQPQGGHADYCVTAENFVLASAQQCNRPGQKLARFTTVKPSETEQGLTAYLSEEAEYTDEQARDAGIQRLLVIAGYDANPIDGIRGGKTDTALAQFIADNKLDNTAAGRADFFELLMAAAQKPGGAVGLLQHRKGAEHIAAKSAGVKLVCDRGILGNARHQLERRRTEGIGHRRQSTDQRQTGNAFVQNAVVVGATLDVGEKVRHRVRLVGIVKIDVDVAEKSAPIAEPEANGRARLGVKFRSGSDPCCNCNAGQCEEFNLLVHRSGNDRRRKLSLCFWKHNGDFPARLP